MAKKTTEKVSKTKTVKKAEKVEIIKPEVPATVVEKKEETPEINAVEILQETTAETPNENSVKITNIEDSSSAVSQDVNSCPKCKCGYAGRAVAVLVLFGLCALMLQNRNLVQRISVLEQNVAKMEGNLSQNVENNRKIYIFNMDETVKGIGLQAANQKFETDINDLDAQVKEAQATIEDLKDEKMKVKVLNLSIKPLQMKRDDLLDAYSKSMQKYLAQINEALAKIATEKNVPVIFMSKSVAVNTNYVVDVTDEVIERVKSVIGTAQ